MSCPHVRSMSCPKITLQDCCCFSSASQLGNPTAMTSNDLCCLASYLLFFFSDGCRRWCTQVCLCRKRRYMRVVISKLSTEGSNMSHALCHSFIFPGGGLDRKLSELCCRTRNRKRFFLPSPPTPHFPASQLQLRSHFCLVLQHIIWDVSLSVAHVLV